MARVCHDASPWQEEEDNVACQKQQQHQLPDTAMMLVVDASWAGACLHRVVGSDYLVEGACCTLFVVLVELQVEEVPSLTCDDE